MNDTLNVQHIKCDEAQAVDEIISKEEDIRILSARAVSLAIHLMNPASERERLMDENYLSYVLKRIDQLKAEVY